MLSRMSVTVTESEDSMGKLLAGLILGMVIFPALALAYVMLGLAPAAATAPPMPFERFLAGTALHNRISREAPQRDLSSFTNQDLIAGADVYKRNCAVCHGLPPLPAPPIAKAMFPGAPQLLTPEGMITDDAVGVTYWKVRNGIRLSGMPSFEAVLSDQQKWEVSALLARADQLPPEAQEALKPGPAAVIPAPAASVHTK
ncbi:MAG: cytochrome c [Candidatus Acidiferrales bacterium]